ncbi:hypothetical protein [Streptococcus plurextorum]
MKQNELACEDCKIILYVDKKKMKQIIIRFFKRVSVVLAWSLVLRMGRIGNEN